MKFATNVHPSAGHGKGSVETQTHPSWASASPVHNSGSWSNSVLTRSRLVGRLPPAAERLEERALRFGRERLRRQRPGGADRRAHLREIRLAPLAVRDVLVEALVQLVGKRAFQVVRHELDQLLAGELFVGVRCLRHVTTSRDTAPAPPEPSSAPGGAGPADWSRSASMRYRLLPRSTPRRPAARSPPAASAAARRSSARSRRASRPRAAALPGTRLAPTPS